ncbi:hypothetical protein GQ37_014125 [Janthinobacterium sp. BJB1]|nr:hypothetical protein GQ37_014125 [Janthinobacterium sp. BJB1]
MRLHPYLVFLYVNDCDSAEFIAFLAANNLNFVSVPKINTPETPDNQLAPYTHGEACDRISVTCRCLCAMNSTWLACGSLNNRRQTRYFFVFFSALQIIDMHVGSSQTFNNTADQLIG